MAFREDDHRSFLNSSTSFHKSGRMGQDVRACTTVSASSFDLRATSRQRYLSTLLLHLSATDNKQQTTDNSNTQQHNSLTHSLYHTHYHTFATWQAASSFDIYACGVCSFHPTYNDIATTFIFQSFHRSYNDLLLVADYQQLSCLASRSCGISALPGVNSRPDVNSSFKSVVDSSFKSASSGMRTVCAWQTSASVLVTNVAPNCSAPSSRSS